MPFSHVPSSTPYFWNTETGSLSNQAVDLGVQATVKVEIPAAWADATDEPLKDIVRTLAEADGRSQLCRVDDVEVCVLAREVALHLRREMLLELLDRPRAVEQEGAAVLEVCGNVVLFNVGRGVNRDKIRRIDQISADRARSSR